MSIFSLNSRQEQISTFYKISNYSFNGHFMVNRTKCFCLLLSFTVGIMFIYSQNKSGNNLEQVIARKTTSLLLDSPFCWCGCWIVTISKVCQSLPMTWNEKKKKDHEWKYRHLMLWNALQPHVYILLSNLNNTDFQTIHKTCNSWHTDEIISCYKYIIPWKDRPAQYEGLL